MGLGKKLLIGSALVGSLFLNNCESPWNPVSQSGESGDYIGEDTGNVTGTILWDPDGDGNYTGVSDAYVELREESVLIKSTKTGSGGSFSLQNVPIGLYKMSSGIIPSYIPDIQCSGSTNVLVTKDEKITKNIKMSCWDL